MKDHWVHPYSGLPNGAGGSTEVITTGMEYLFGYDYGVRNYKVTYEAGYWSGEGTAPKMNDGVTEVPKCPADLQQECLDLVAYMYKNRGEDDEPVVFQRSRITCGRDAE